MEIVRHTTGRTAGAISVLNTIETMQVGDVWIADPAEVRISTVYTTCSEFSVLHNVAFSVSLKEHEGKITITRKL